MLKLIVVFIGLYVCFQQGFASDEYTDDKQFKGSFPLRIFVQFNVDHSVIVEDPAQYLSQMNEEVVNSILSEKEIWNLNKIRNSQENVHHYMQQFYTWYFNQLPLLIFADKKRFTDQGNLAAALRKGYFTEINFLFLADNNINSETLISLADRYEYTFSEKLNLFLYVLYKNISEVELLKLQTAWGITGNSAVYIRDYQKYMKEFFQYLQFPSDSKRKEIILLFNTTGAAFTSVLHEFFITGKKVLFAKMLKSPEVDLNLQDYLLQTIVHKVANGDWKKTANYLPSLLRHPKVNLNIQDYQGWTPLFYAITSNESHRSPAFQQFMNHKSKIDMSIMDYNLRTMPLVAAELNKPALSHFLHSQGAPLPPRVSLFNSYITEDYRTIWFKNRIQFDLNNLVNVLDVKNNAPSFREFQQYLSDGFVEKDAIVWDQFKYHFLFHLLNKTLLHEENIRYSTIMSWLFDEKHTIMNNGFDTRLIKAIYQKNIPLLKSMITKQYDRNMLNDNLFYTQYIFEKSWSKKVISDFHLLERINVTPLPQSDKTLLFYVEVSSLLSEAIRANHFEVVEFLLREGADPTIETKNFVTRNSIVTAILMGDLLYRYSEPYKEHLRIVDILMSHPSVTKDFLSKDIIPGISHVDLSALRGHFHILKKMYQKGAHVTEDNTSLWETGFPIEAAVIKSHLAKTMKFILEKKIKRYPKDQMLRNSLQRCREAFN